MYTLAVGVVGQGTVTKEPDRNSYASGSTVTLSALAAPRWVFKGWSGVVTSASNPLVVTMEAHKTLTAAFESEGATQAVTSFTLVNADTDQDIGPLRDGDLLNLSTLPTQNLNVRATTTPAAGGSVHFVMDGTISFRTENVSPYALAGDVYGDYRPWTPLSGVHMLTATPYREADGGGTAGTSLSITFEVVDR